MVDEIQVLDVTQETPDIVIREAEIRRQHLVKDITEVAFKDLQWIENVRPEDELFLDRIIASYKLNGYKANHPIVVSKHGKKFTVLCGNRRTLGLAKLKDTDPEIFKMILPSGKIPAVVYENLTPAQEALIMVDHGPEEDRQALSDAGVFLAVKKLFTNGVVGRYDIAQKLGLFTKTGEPNGSFIQKRVQLCQLPSEVQDEFMKFMKDKNSSNVRWNNITKLYTLWNASLAAGQLKGSPEYKAFWETCKSATDGGSSAGTVKAMTKSELSTTAKKLNSSLGRLTLMKVAGNDVKHEDNETPWTLEELDAEISKAEAALFMLDVFAQELGEKEFKRIYNLGLEKHLAAQAAAEKPAN